LIVQQASLNSAHLTIPLNAVADAILRAPQSGIVVLAGINSDGLRFLLEYTDAKTEERRALFLSLGGIQSAEAIVERTAEALAETALQMWPVWYSNLSFADIRADTLGSQAARSRVREIGKPSTPRPMSG
jgi:hypothetical protein